MVRSFDVVLALDLSANDTDFGVADWECLESLGVAKVSSDGSTNETDL